MRERIVESLARYAFTDPWGGGSETFRVDATVAEISLDGLGSLGQRFDVVAAELPTEDPAATYSDPRAEWCPD